MPAETFSKPLEKILDGKCSYEYYDYTNDTSSQTKKLEYVMLLYQIKAITIKMSY